MDFRSNNGSEHELSHSDHQDALAGQSDAERAEKLSGYFKTGPGEYAEGDRFLGLKVPQIRKIVQKHYREASESDIEQLITSVWHEERLCALLILVRQFEHSGAEQRKSIYDFYLNHTDWINNWDLVDSSAPRIVGGWLLEREKSPLFRLAESGSLWERRIAMLATAAFIDRGSFDTTLKIAAMLLMDDHDLIHKAVGWMLREIGKRDLRTEEDFLKQHYRRMPRTMLRYAIERFPPSTREAYLKGKI